MSTSSGRDLGWEAVVTADRDYYERVAAEGVNFPTEWAPRRFTLDGEQIHIGRRSAAREVEPDLDLSGAVEDPAISHVHALLLRGRDGGYSLVDPGSTNGTTINDHPTPVAANAAIPLKDGDRIHLGAWTLITIVAVGTGDGG